MVGGGTVACLISQAVYKFFPLKNEWLSAVEAGVLEEVAKAVPAIITIAILKQKNPYACFLVAATVGAGFSVIEQNEKSAHVKPGERAAYARGIVAQSARKNFLVLRLRAGAESFLKSEGTAAFRLKDVPPEMKSRRLHKLLERKGFVNRFTLFKILRAGIMPVHRL